MIIKTTSFIFYYTSLFVTIRKQIKTMFMIYFWYTAGHRYTPGIHQRGTKNTGRYPIVVYPILGKVVFGDTTYYTNYLTIFL